MTHIVNKQAVARAFGRAASGYDRYAGLQRSSGEQLARYARQRQGQNVLDAGCGTGWFSQRWRYAGNEVTALDLSAEMLLQAQSQQAADRYLTGDIEALPFAQPCFDLCWSNLAVQWCSDLSLALHELYRVTRPGARCCFPRLPPDPLMNLILPGEGWTQSYRLIAFSALMTCASQENCCRCSGIIKP